MPYGTRRFNFGALTATSVGPSASPRFSTPVSLSGPDGVSSQRTAGPRAFAAETAITILPYSRVAMRIGRHPPPRGSTRPSILPCFSSSSIHCGYGFSAAGVTVTSQRPRYTLASCATARESAPNAMDKTCSMPTNLTGSYEAVDFRPVPVAPWIRVQCNEHI